MNVTKSKNAVRGEGTVSKNAHFLDSTPPVPVPSRNVRRTRTLGDSNNQTILIPVSG
jgi:hypothetical protein